MEWPGRPIPSFLRSKRGTVLRSLGPALSNHRGASVHQPWLGASLCSHCMEEGFTWGHFAERKTGSNNRWKRKDWKQTLKHPPSCHKLGYPSFLEVGPCRKVGSIDPGLPLSQLSRVPFSPWVISKWLELELGCGVESKQPITVGAVAEFWLFRGDVCPRPMVSSLWFLSAVPGPAVLSSSEAARGLRSRTDPEIPAPQPSEDPRARTCFNQLCPEPRAHCPARLRVIKP